MLKEPNKLTLLLIAAIFVIIIVVTMIRMEIIPIVVESTDVFCGGIANVECPEGLSCQLEGKYPDAGGTCVRYLLQ